MSTCRLVHLLATASALCVLWIGLWAPFGWHWSKWWAAPLFLALMLTGGVADAILRKRRRASRKRPVDWLTRMTKKPQEWDVQVKTQGPGPAQEL